MLAQRQAPQPRRLIVNWQSTTTRAIIPVAELIERGGAFEFGYLKGAARAQKEGFQPFLAFPQMDSRYQSDRLFPFFTNRVLPSTRPDYLKFLEAFALDPSNANEMEVLGRSLGHRQTDKIETVLEPQRDPTTGTYVTRFLLRGVRHLAGAEEAVLQLASGTDLRAQLRVDNQFNPRARLLLDELSRAVGYVPEYLLGDLDALDAAGELTRFVVERVNPPPSPVHHRVLVRASAKWPVNFQPFVHPDLTPLVPRAA